MDRLILADHPEIETGICRIIRKAAPFPEAIEPGALFRRRVSPVMTEVAEVVEVGTDGLGIPHVRFKTHLARGSFVATMPEPRMLALDIFYMRYRERGQR